mgnify:FL=1
MKSGQPVENSLAGHLTLAEGEVVAWRLDLVGYARLIGNIMLPLAGDDSLEEVFAGLSELKIAPLTGKIDLENGRISSEMRIPVESIKAGFDYFESVQQAALEEPEAINDLDSVVPEAKAE